VIRGHALGWTAIHVVNRWAGREGNGSPARSRRSRDGVHPGARPHSGTGGRSTMEHNAYRRRWVAATAFCATSTGRAACRRRAISSTPSASSRTDGVGGDTEWMTVTAAKVRERHSPLHVGGEDCRDHRLEDRLAEPASLLDAGAGRVSGRRRLAHWEILGALRGASNCPGASWTAPPDGGNLAAPPRRTEWRRRRAADS
jgi:hypothetical protein